MQKIICILFFILQSVVCLKYKIIFEDSQIFGPCPKYPNKYLNNLLDISNVNHTILPDGKFYFAGNMSLLMSEPKNLPMQSSMQLFKKSRGTWTSTVFNMQRSNFCKALIDPSELWYETVINFKFHEPLCPFRKGFLLTVDTITDVIVNIPGNIHEGYYRVDLIIRYGLDLEDFLCAVGYWQIVAA